jgi:uncharacterized protein YndB with AHSA1/START domain
MRSPRRWIGSDVADPIVEVERRLPASPEDVFDFLTDAARYTKWMGRAAELDPKPGGIYRVEMSEDAVALGEYVEVDPPSRIVFSFGWVGDENVPPGSTTVEVALEPDGDGTVLRLRHTGLPDDASAVLHTGGWEMYLDRLIEVAS